MEALYQGPPCKHSVKALSGMGNSQNIVHHLPGVPVNQLGGLVVVSVLWNALFCQMSSSVQLAAGPVGWNTIAKKFVELVVTTTLSYTGARLTKSNANCLLTLNRMYPMMQYICATSDSVIEPCTGQ